MRPNLKVIIPIWIWIIVLWNKLLWGRQRGILPFSDLPYLRLQWDKVSNYSNWTTISWLTCSEADLIAPLSLTFNFKNDPESIVKFALLVAQNKNVSDEMRRLPYFSEVVLTLINVVLMIRCFLYRSEFILNKFIHFPGFVNDPSWLWYIGSDFLCKKLRFYGVLWL